MTVLSLFSTMWRCSWRRVRRPLTPTTSMPTGIPTSTGSTTRAGSRPRTHSRLRLSRRGHRGPRPGRRPGFLLAAPDPGIRGRLDHERHVARERAGPDAGPGVGFELEDQGRRGPERRPVSGPHLPARRHGPPEGLDDEV